MSDKLLHTWKHTHKKQTLKQVGNSELIAENERLKAQLKRAEMERDILKKKHCHLHSDDLKTMYRFIQAQSQTYPVDLLCQTLAVGRSGHYDWLKPGVVGFERTVVLLVLRNVFRLELDRTAIV